MKNRVGAVGQEIVLFAPIRVDRWYQGFRRANPGFLQPSLVNIDRTSAAGKESDHASQRFQERRYTQEMRINIKSKSVFRLRLKTGDDQILSWRNAELGQHLIEQRRFGASIQEKQKAATFLPISMQDGDIVFGQIVLGSCQNQGGKFTRNLINAFQSEFLKDDILMFECATKTAQIGIISYWKLPMTADQSNFDLFFLR